MHAFAEVAEVEAVLERLQAPTIQDGRSLIARLERLPGRKEHRYAQILGATPVAERAPEPATPEQPDRPHADDRLARLEDEVAGLRAEVAALRRELDELRARDPR
jgi:uncharacterized protein YceH (UPF0502 family)